MRCLLTSLHDLTTSPCLCHHAPPIRPPLLPFLPLRLPSDESWNGLIDGIVNDEDVDFEDTPERAPQAGRADNTLHRVASMLLKSGSLSKEEVQKVKHIVLFQDESVSQALLAAERKGAAALAAFLRALPAGGACLGGG